MPQLPQGNHPQMILTDLDSQACYKPVPGEDPVRIDSTNAQVNSYNRSISRKTDAPIINTACSSIDGGDNVVSHDARNLQQQLSLCSGAKAMLTENILWRAKGLCERGNWHHC